MLTKEDIKCLKNVTRLQVSSICLFDRSFNSNFSFFIEQVEDFEDNRSGYSIQFYFSENSWFENEVITKEYHLPWHGNPKKDFIK